MTMIYIIKDANDIIWAVSADREKAWDKLIELEKTFDATFKMAVMTDLKDM